MIPNRAAHPAPNRRAIDGFVVGAGATAVAGAVLAFGVQPATTISVDMWRYPWSSSGAFVAFSIVSAVLHGLVVAGLVAFGRSGVAGQSRAARVGVGLAVAGTALLLVGEFLSIPPRGARADDTSASIVGAFFGLAAITSTIGFLLAGWATLRAGVWHGWRRVTPLAVGLWLVVLVPLPALAPTLLHGGVGIHGLCLLAMAVALRRHAAATNERIAPAGRDRELERA